MTDPDWYSWTKSHSLDTWISRLDWLRHDHPIVWMILTTDTESGIGSDAIAKRLGWPLDYTLLTLREYKRERILVDVEPKSKRGRALLWCIAEGSRFNMDWDLEDLIDFWLERRRQVDLDLARRSR